MFKYLITILTFMSSNTLYAYDFYRVAHEHVLTTYQQLVSQTKQVNISAVRFCEDISSSHRSQLQNDMTNAFLAWQASQHIRFGPVQSFSREYRFEFWPDKRGIVSKQVKQLLNDPLLHSDEFDITSKSVAVQGFSALERILFSNKAIKQSDCLLITAITKNLLTMSENILIEWSSGDNAFIHSFLNPGPKNIFFMNNSELAGRLLNSLFTQLELITTQKLNLPLGENIEKSRKRLAQGWRSNTSLAAIKANLHACQQLYQLTFADELQDEALRENISSGFDQANQLLDDIELPMTAAIQDTVARTKLLHLYEILTKLKSFIARDLANSLDLSLGFNSLDGD